MDAFEAIFEPAPRIEEALQGLCAGDAGTPAALADSMRYAVLGEGKRLRPLLCFHSFEVLAGPFDSAPPDVRDALLRACVAVELVHAFSLVHDDLPALDNDDLRRGRPTLHRHAGEAAAVLAGDALLTWAVCILARIEARRARACTDLLARATWSMVRGQVLDTLGGLDPRLSPREQVRTIHEQKTGALIEASCLLGAACALPPHESTCDNPAWAPLREYGRVVGLMYQIVDDLLDEEQSSEHAGKRTGKDRLAGKLTYPGVLGPAGARGEVERLRASAHDALRPLGRRATILKALADFLATRTK
jgi:geranylgeranyl pyrophosphate synthase